MKKISKQSLVILFCASIIFFSSAPLVFSESFYHDDVPVYDQDWFNGSCTNDCGPTAGGMVLGWYDSHGWPRMVHAGSNNFEKNPLGVMDFVQDLSATMDYQCNIGTFTTEIGPGIETSATNMDPGASFSTNSDDFPAFWYNLLKDCINNHGPLAFFSVAGLIYYYGTDYSDELSGNHFMTMIGYDDGGTHYESPSRWIKLHMGWGDYKTPAWVDWDHCGSSDLYTVRVYSGGTPSADDDDNFEDNDSFDYAKDITITTYNSLVCYDQDFFIIDPLFTGNLEITIKFIHSQGNLDLFIYDEYEGLLYSSSSYTDDEQVEFPVNSGEKYYILVHPSLITGPTTYDMTITSYKPAIAFSPSNFTFTAQQGGSNPPSQTLSIWNSGEGVLNWTLSSSESWVNLNPISGDSAGETDQVNVSVNASGKTMATYAAIITISDPNAENSPQEIPVLLTVTGGSTPVLSVLPEGTLDFGEVSTSRYLDKAFTVLNIGGQTLSGSAVTSGPFSIVSGSPFSLGSGEQSEVVVRFQPPSTNTYLYDIAFTSNGGNETRQVRGTGTTSAARCGNPILLSCGATYEGSTFEGLDNYNRYYVNGVEHQYLYGKEQVHSFTIETQRTVTINAWLNDYNNSGGYVELFVVTSCEGSSTNGSGIAHREDDGSITLTDLDPGAYYLIVDSGMNDEGDYKISISCTEPPPPPNNPPNQPSNPSPSNGAIDQPINLTLSWNASDPDGDTLSYDIYLDTNNPPTTLVAQNYSSTSLGVNLNYETQWFWKVVAKDGKDETPGPVWSFSTQERPNNSPNTPSIPGGPSSGVVGTSYDFSTSTTDPDGDSVTYRFDWGDGTTSGWGAPTQSHAYTSVNTYYVKAQAQDEHGATSEWSGTHSIIIEENHAPNTPSVPGGLSSGVVGTSYDFSTSTTDPDGDSVTYRFDWGDGTTSGWGAPTQSHAYTSVNTYYVKAQAQDEHGATSEWSGSLMITIRESAACAPSVVETVPIPGTILPYYDGGLEHDGTHLWANVNRLAPEVRVYEIDPSDGSILRSYLQNHYNPSSSNVIGLAYDSANNLIYNQVYPYGPIYAVDANTLVEVPGSSISVPASWIHDIAFDSVQQILWAVKDNGTIYKMDPSDGSVLGSFTSPGNIGVTWDGNYLWVCGGGYVYQIDPDQALADGNCDNAIIQEIYLPDIGATGGRLAWDGRFLWTASSTVFYKIDVCAARTSVASDFDGDFETDIAIYRTATGVWWIYPSSTGTPYAVGFGGHSSDIPVSGDYDSDGEADVAVYRAASGVWWITPSSTGTPYAVGFGGHSSDIPAPGDYDGDFETDIAIYRAETGVWWINPSSTGTPYAVGFGGHYSDIPVSGDYDCDGQTDIAIYRAASGVWWIRPSSTGTPYAVGFGGHYSDIPVSGDYDCDGQTDIAIYRAASGVWWIRPSSTGTPYAVGFGGHSSDIPAPGDYDGDGETDIAIFRVASGVWWIRPSSTGTPYAVGFGGHPSDMPVNPVCIHLY